MTDQELQDFVTRFAAAWASRDGEAFLALWHPEGRLHYPMVNRTLTGAEIPRLNQIQKEAVPDLVWQLLDWTSRGNTLTIEWQCTRVANGKRFEWRGIDKFRIEDGRILEERVYMDTAPLRAAQSGAVLEPMLPM